MHDINEWTVQKWLNGLRCQLISRHVWALRSICLFVGWLAWTLILTLIWGCVGHPNTACMSSPGSFTFFVKGLDFPPCDTAYPHHSPTSCYVYCKAQDCLRATVQQDVNKSQLMQMELLYCWTWWTLSVVNSRLLSVYCWQHLAMSTFAKYCQWQTDVCCLFMSMAFSDSECAKMIFCLNLKIEENTKGNTFIFWDTRISLFPVRIVRGKPPCQKRAGST